MFSSQEALLLMSTLNFFRIVVVAQSGGAHGFRLILHIAKFGVWHSCPFLHILVQMIYI